MLNKLIVIVGPTASGKSALAVQLARKFNGEIVSADSRQVYKGLTIGTGKITQKEMMGIPHHLLDVASPKRRFTVAQYRYRAITAIASIVRQGKLPILVGGSPFYIYSLVDGWTIPEVKPNPLLRKKLGKLSVQELFLKLKKLDPARARTLQQSPSTSSSLSLGVEDLSSGPKGSGQAKNKRRLIRALEIVLTTKKPVPLFKMYSIRVLWYQNDVLFIGIKKSPKEIKTLIAKRLAKRFRLGMIKEVEKLHRQGVSWKRLEEFGLEYRFVALYLQKKLSRKEMMIKLQKAIKDFARRQMTWFKKDPRIHWIKSSQEAKALVRQFLLSSAK